MLLVSKSSLYHISYQYFKRKQTMMTGLSLFKHQLKLDELHLKWAADRGLNKQENMFRN